jgi:hypothetical protein
MIWWRLRTVDNKTDCWVRFISTTEIINIADRLGAVYPSINVIRFKCAEDILMFRLKAGV